MFRLADIYLMYAECVVRGGGGDMGTAVDYVNLVGKEPTAIKPAISLKLN